MHLIFPEGVTQRSFLHLFWQQRPLFFPGAIPDYVCPVSPETLAGLSCEDHLESRIVLEQGESSWQLLQGPFSEQDFEELPHDHWTLLIQDMDKERPDISKLLDLFDFLPSWRLDDIMISYAADQGSVGPHTDEYDVFLFQAAGKRRWRINRHHRGKQRLRPDTELRILEEFHPDQEWLMEPGDLLYLPPGMPHWGIAEGESITFSIGFRSPGHQEMLLDWCHYLAEKIPDQQHYRDPVLEPDRCQAEICTDDIGVVSDILKKALTHGRSDITQWFGCLVTEPKEHLEIEAQHDQPEAMTNAGFLEDFRSQSILYRHPYARLAFAETEEHRILLFVNGRSLQIAIRHRHFVEAITAQHSLHFGYLSEWLEDQDCLSVLKELFCLGVFVFND